MRLQKLGQSLPCHRLSERVESGLRHLPTLAAPLVLAEAEFPLTAGSRHGEPQSPGFGTACRL